MSETIEGAFKGVVRRRKADVVSKTAPWLKEMEAPVPLNPDSPETYEAAQHYRDEFLRTFGSLERPSISSFSIGTPEGRVRDEKWVHDTRLKFGARGTEQPQMIEDFLAVQLAHSRWLEGVKVVPTSAYDDYANGVDFVLEWLKRDGETVTPRLAIDVTTRSDQKLLEKLARGEKGAEVKYFRSALERDASGKSVEKSLRLPQAVVGLNDSLFSFVVKTDGSETTRKQHEVLEALVILQAARQMERTLLHLADATRSPSWRISREGAMAVAERLSEALEKIKGAPEVEGAVRRIVEAADLHRRLAAEGVERVA